MDRKIVALVKQATGLSPSPQFAVARRSPRANTPDLYEEGEISCLNLSFGIASTIGHDFKFCWKSKSGDIVRICDEGFDEEDLDCWLEDVTPEKYYEDLSLYGNKKPPFKLKNLPFELEIRDYAYSMDVFVRLKEQTGVEEIRRTLDEVIVVFNENADALARGIKKGKILQAVHNWKISLTEEGLIKIYLDAASPEVLKAIVKHLSKYPSVEKVEMDLMS
ncbi:hypothetical protein ACJVDH_14450 [Pedobacter sp. AW1-32]|uniref:hypothetical protein n=1 Tax=Pedobacter sp. AW1-32 TaxID=3383026 RepID=UPI003FED787D